MAGLEDLSYGKYNATINLTDVTGQYVNTTEEILIYPKINVTFKITDQQGNPNERRLRLYFGPYSRYSYYNSIRMSGLRSLFLPNVSYFRKSSHVYLENDIGYFSNVYVTFLNSSLKGNMDITTEYHEEDKFVDDKILHSYYTFRPSWDYEGTDFSFYYYESDLSKLNVLRKSDTTVYTCSEWDFSSKECKTEWEEAEITYKYAYSVEIEGKGGKIEALGFGEPQFCGDGSCSSSEDCSSCPEDCGDCPLTTEPPTTTVETQISDDNATTTTSSSTTTISVTTTTVVSNYTTTIISCRENGMTCIENEACCSGYCCNKVCSDTACKVDEGFKTYYIIIIVVIISVSAAGYLYYTKFLGKSIFRKPEMPSPERTEIVSLSKRVNAFKTRGYNVADAERELTLSGNALKKGLKNASKKHLENVKRILQSLR